MTTELHVTKLADLTLDELAADEEAERLVARLTGSGQRKPLRVAAFQSHIDVEPIEEEL